MLQGLNHITIAVSDLEHSLAFYTELLGMKAHVRWDAGAYLSLDGVWFCLSCDAPKPSLDYSHLALDIVCRICYKIARSRYRRMEAEPK